MHKNKLKCIKDINVRPVIIKLLKEKVRSILFDIGLSNIFFEYVSTGKGNKSKNKQMGLHQIKNFSHKETIN